MRTCLCVLVNDRLQRWYVLCFDLWNLLKANVKFKTNNSWPNQIGCISQPSPAWQPRLVAARLMRDSRYLSRLSIAVNYLFPTVFTSWIVALFLWRFDVFFCWLQIEIRRWTVSPSVSYTRSSSSLSSVCRLPHNLLSTPITCPHPSKLHLSLCIDKLPSKSFTKKHFLSSLTMFRLVWGVRLNTKNNK